MSFIIHGGQYLESWRSDIDLLTSNYELFRKEAFYIRIGSHGYDDACIE